MIPAVSTVDCGWERVVGLRRRVLAGVAGVVVAVGGLATSAGTAGATLAGGCTTPECIRGVPPVLLAECSEPKCLSGTRPGFASLAECSEPKCLSGTQPVIALLASCPDPRCINGVPPVRLTA
jgi:hypothetical protein